VIRRIPGRSLATPVIPLAEVQNAQRMEALLASHALHAATLARAEDDIAQITRRAVEAIVGAELAHKPEHVRAIVRELIRGARAATRVLVHVHPDDRALLPSASELAEQAEARGTLEIVVDASLARGDCVLSSDHGEIDGRISTKLRHVAEHLDTRNRP